MPKRRNSFVWGGGQREDTQNSFFHAILGIKLMPKIIISFGLFEGV
jgi:hypothetical protein